MHKEINTVTLDDWIKSGEYCIKIQEDFVNVELRDEIWEPIIMTINPDESSSSEDENDDND